MSQLDKHHCLYAGRKGMTGRKVLSDDLEVAKRLHEELNGASVEPGSATRRRTRNAPHFYSPQVRLGKACNRFSRMSVHIIYLLCRWKVQLRNILRKRQIQRRSLQGQDVHSWLQTWCSARHPYRQPARGSAWRSRQKRHRPLLQGQ